MLDWPLSAYFGFDRFLGIRFRRRHQMQHPNIQDTTIAEVAPAIAEITSGSDVALFVLPGIEGASPSGVTPVGTEVL